MTTVSERTPLLAESHGLDEEAAAKEGPGSAAAASKSSRLRGCGNSCICWCWSIAVPLLLFIWLLARRYMYAVNPVSTSPQVPRFPPSRMDPASNRMVDNFPGRHQKSDAGNEVMPQAPSSDNDDGEIVAPKSDREAAASEKTTSSTDHFPSRSDNRNESPPYVSDSDDDSKSVDDGANKDYPETPRVSTSREQIRDGAVEHDWADDTYTMAPQKSTPSARSHEWTDHATDRQRTSSSVSADLPTASDDREPWTADNRGRGDADSRQKSYDYSVQSSAGASDATVAEHEFADDTFERKNVNPERRPEPPVVVEPTREVDNVWNHGKEEPMDVPAAPRDSGEDTDTARWNHGKDEPREVPAAPRDSGEDTGTAREPPAQTSATPDSEVAPEPLPPLEPVELTADCSLELELSWFCGGVLATAFSVESDRIQAEIAKYVPPWVRGVGLKFESGRIFAKPTVRIASPQEHALFGPDPELRLRCTFEALMRSPKVQGTTRLLNQYSGGVCGAKLGGSQCRTPKHSEVTSQCDPSRDVLIRL